MGYGRLDGCGNCIKYGMFITNLIIFIGGIILVGIGVWTIVDKSFANELLGTNLYAGAVYVIVVTGALILLISCFGCFGSIKEVRCLLVAYFIAVFIIFVTMLVGGILGYVFRGKVETTLENAMYSTLRSYGNYKPVTDAWDDTQKTLRCCGVQGPRDWALNLPDSCCRESVPGRRQNCQMVVQQDGSVLYKDGCLKVTKQFVKDHAVIIGSAGVVVACLMILGMIFSCALYKKIDD